MFLSRFRKCKNVKIMKQMAQKLLYHSQGKSKFPFLARYLVSIALENHENDENIVKNVDF